MSLHRTVNTLSVKQPLASRLPVAFSACVFCLLVATVPAFSQTFRVEKVRVCSNAITDWTSPCTEIAPPFDNLDRSFFANNRLYVQLRIACEKPALDFLQSNFFLPIYVVVWKDGAKKPDIPLPISQTDWAKNGGAWSSMVNQDGGFPWVTFFDVGLFDFKSVEFQIVDDKRVVAYIGTEPARFALKFSK
jgi:hypothetical protein